MEFHVCWTIDCESSRREISDLELGENAIRGVAGILEEKGWRGTFFLIPEEIPPLARLLEEKLNVHELGLHFHPDESGLQSPYLGTYSCDYQKEIIQKAQEIFQKHFGVQAVSCRPGYCSANDSTFAVMAACGLRQASASIPGRRMTSTASNWAGAPLFSHYAHPYNRFLSGGLDFVEIPVSVDWESMIWGGLHPQDLRVEYTDEKNHSFLIEKIMRRQVAENLPLKALVVLTHNLFRYSDTGDFRRDTMLGMIATIERCAKEMGLEIVGSTLEEAASAYRAAAPLQL